MKGSGSESKRKKKIKDDGKNGNKTRAFRLLRDNGYTKQMYKVNEMHKSE